VIAQALSASIEANWNSQVTWLQRLVRFPSLRGQEAECQDWLQTEFEARGWAVDRYSLADVDLPAHSKAAPMIGISVEDSIQLVATVPHDPANSGRSLILQGHVDVVPTGSADRWADDPFGGAVRDGWLHGRGAQDMKSGLSAIIFALDAIRHAGFTLNAPVFVQSVTEEESTGNGALSTLLRGYRADACLIPEPTSGTLTRAQTGALWFKLVVEANPGHVARSAPSANVIVSAMGIIEALSRLTAELNRGVATDRWFAPVSSPIKFNPGVIRGGDWASSTPSWCEVDCRIGLLPGQSTSALQEQIARVVAETSSADPLLSSSPVRVIWNGFVAEGCVLEPGSEAEAVLGRAHERVHGRCMEARVSTAVNDTRYYALDGGMTALCYGPAGKGMHGFNERADLDSLKKTTQTLALFVSEWCGLNSP
jgi:acetylornithine deacetylase